MWKNRVRLSPGEALEFKSKHEKGNLGQEEVELYSVVDSEGKVIGSVRYIDHMSIKAPFHRSLHLIQIDSMGKALVDERWNL